VLKYGGAKALTKHLPDDALKLQLSVEVTPKIIDNTTVLSTPNVMRQPKGGKMKTRMVKAKVTVKKSRLEKATSHLYDLEENNAPEKPLNIDFGLYQMEDF
jgi:hypothetical protein